MLNISRPAYDRLATMLADRPDDVAVRIFLRQGRARIRPGREREGDKLIAHDGRTVILLDPKAAQHVEQRTLGTSDTEDGPRLRLKRSKHDD